MTVFRVLLLLCVFVPALAGTAQDQAPKPAELPDWKLKNYAKGYKRIGDYFSAIDMAEEYLNRHPKSVKMQRELADLYRLSRDYKSALQLYEKLFQNNPDAEAHYRYAQMLIRTGDFAKAKESLEVFKFTYPEENSKYQEYYASLHNELAGAEFALTQKTDRNIQLTHLDSSVNNPHIDFAPVPVNDSVLLYASLKSIDAMLESDDMPRRRFYMAVKVDSATYRPMELPFHVNDPFMDCGNGAYSPSGKRFYFTRCDKVEGKTLCNIYYIAKTETGWSEPQVLGDPVNYPLFTSTYPTVGLDSKGEEVLYFASDRPGGRGGLDLWYAAYDEKRNIFKYAKNCGEVINTAGDEITPWYRPDTRSLYFSTASRPGIGGFDIYKTDGELKKWNEPENIGMPFNSSADDMFYILKRNREKGFLVSNREGGMALENETCCDDIYEFAYVEFREIKVFGDVVLVPDSTQEQDDTGELPSVSLYQKVANEYLLIETKPTNPDSTYEFILQPGKQYQVVATRPGYLKDSKSFSTKGMAKVDSIRADHRLEQIPLLPIIIKNIYYPFDKDYLTETSQLIIDTTIYKIMSDNPDIIVEIGSHTDAMGTEEYNHDLSQRRAQSVVNYLISKGISVERLQAKGYGEDVPLAPNSLPDGSDNPEGRQKNRRTEFRVIGFLPGVSDIIYEE